MSGWTAPVDVRAEVERLWERGVLPQAVAERACGSPASQLCFPLRLRLRRPRPADLGRSFDGVRAWIRELEASAAMTGFDITWDDVNTREIGRNRLPSALVLPSLDAALSLIGRTDDAARLAGAVVATLEPFPSLRPWLVKRASLVLEHLVDWPKILGTVAWFATNPRPGLYLRQIDVPGVDSKFFESRRSLLTELLDAVLPLSTINTRASGVAAFEARYGLATKPALVRFRVLDRHLAVQGLTDLTVRLDAFAALAVPATRVFIVENEVTFLAFPECPGAIVIFGSGYGVERLAVVTWLRGVTCTYWGDIDTHGFAILDQLRAVLPDVVSMLMDKETLLALRPFWTRERAPHVADLGQLTDAERAVYDDLRFDRLGIGVRLEQERIPMRWLEHYSL
jgi:hypothetical protein